MSVVADCSLEELKDELAAHAAHMSAGMCRYLELVGECERRGACSGWDSTAEWLAWRCGLTPRTAREHVRVARALEELPLIRTAFGCGEVSYSKVRVLTRVGRPEREDELLETAKVLTASQLERALRAYQRVMTEQAREVQEWEKLSCFWDDDGSLVVRGRLAPEDGALFLKALEAAREKLWNEHEAVTERGSAEPPPAPQRPSNVDALVAVAEDALADQSDAHGDGDRFQVRGPRRTGSPGTNGRRQLPARRRPRRGSRDGTPPGLRRLDRDAARTRRRAPGRRKENPQGLVSPPTRLGGTRRLLPLPRLHQPSRPGPPHQALGRRRRNRPGEPRPALPPPSPPGPRRRLGRGSPAPLPKPLRPPGARRSTPATREPQGTPSEKSRARH